MDNDPGWGLSWWVLAVLVFPPSAFLFTRGRRDLLSLRKYFVASGLALIGFLRVILTLPVESSTRHPVYGLAAVGFAAICCGAVLIFPTQLVADEDKRLAASYVAASLVGMAFALSGALWGFVVFFPTRAHLAKAQRQVEAAGSSLSVVRALQSPTTR